MEKANLSRKEIIVKDLINYALSEVEGKYGKGEGDGKAPRSYHNRVHTQDVLSATQQIARLSLEAGKISDSDVSLVGIAASFHDIEQDLGSGLNEEKSANLAEEEMRKAGLFGVDDIQKVKRMILATTVYFEDGIMKQSATEEYLTQVLADADLSSLGQEPSFYWNRAERLLKEIKKTDTPAKEDKVAFAEKQLTLLGNHRFYTKEAGKLFTHKQENVKLTQQRFESLKD